MALEPLEAQSDFQVVLASNQEITRAVFDMNRKLFQQGVTGYTKESFIKENGDDFSDLAVGLCPEEQIGLEISPQRNVCDLRYNPEYALIETLSSKRLHRTLVLKGTGAMPIEVSDLRYSKGSTFCHFPSSELGKKRDETYTVEEENIRVVHDNGNHFGQRKTFGVYMQEASLRHGDPEYDGKDVLQGELYLAYPLGDNHVQYEYIEGGTSIHIKVTKPHPDLGGHTDGVVLEFDVTAEGIKYDTKSLFGKLLENEGEFFKDLNSDEEKEHYHKMRLEIIETLRKVSEHVSEFHLDLDKPKETSIFGITPASLRNVATKDGLRARFNKACESAVKAHDERVQERLKYEDNLRRGINNTEHLPEHLKEAREIREEERQRYYEETWFQNLTEGNGLELPLLRYCEHVLERGYIDNDVMDLIKPALRSFYLRNAILTNVRILSKSNQSFPVERIKGRIIDDVLNRFSEKSEEILEKRASESISENEKAELRDFNYLDLFEQTLTEICSREGFTITFVKNVQEDKYDQIREAGKRQDLNHAIREMLESSDLYEGKRRLRLTSAGNQLFDLRYALNELGIESRELDARIRNIETWYGHIGSLGTALRLKICPGSEMFNRFAKLYRRAGATEDDLESFTFQCRGNFRNQVERLTGFGSRPLTENEWSVIFGLADKWNVSKDDRVLMKKEYQLSIVRFLKDPKVSAYEKIQRSGEWRQGWIDGVI